MDVAFKRQAVWVDGRVEREAASIWKGKKRSRSYEDNQSVKRYVTEEVGEEIILLDKKDG